VDTEVRLEGSIEDRAWPAWVWSPQDRSIVAANDKARALWNLAPTTSTTGFLFPARAKVTRKLHGAAVALLAGAEQVQIDIKLPFAAEETWQCRRVSMPGYADGALLLEAPQYASAPPRASEAGQANHQDASPLWSDEAFNALGLPVIMTAADGKILHLNQEADRLAPSDIMSDDLGTSGELWSRPWHFRDFFSTHNDVDHAMGAMAEAHRTGSASFIASLMGVPGFPGGRTQILIQRVGAGRGQAPLMITFHKLAESQRAPTNSTEQASVLDGVHDELSRMGAVAFELNDQGRVIFFTPGFAAWLGKDPQDIGGRKVNELGVTPANGASMMQMTNDKWEDGRHMIRQPDGTISTMNIKSLLVPTREPGQMTRLCLCLPIVQADKAVPEPVFENISDENLHDDPSTDELLALFESDEVKPASDQNTNLIRLDDWREGDEIVLTGDSFRALIESLDAALIGLDEAGKIKFVNKPVEKLLGRSASDLEGAPLASAFRAASAGKLARFFESPGGPEKSKFTSGAVLEPLSAASKKDHLVLRLHALREKSPIRYCAFLKPQYVGGANLADDTGTSTRSARKRADFVAQMSHEIRTPLNAILGFSDLILSEGMGPIGNEKYKEYMQDIHDSGNLILSLINDVLDLAKVEATGLTVDMKGFNLDASIRQATSMLTAQAEARSIDVAVEIVAPLPVIFADERSVMQILLNLISNAIKFTPGGGTISITAQPSDRDYVSLVVADTGIGMTKQELERALAPFQQISSGNMIEKSAGPSGTGLGLPITKALAEANNARFKISSTRNKGTRIEILFNKARAAAE
jgi:signal transduction histidine kinase/PAS domain-containing protein